MEKRYYFLTETESCPICDIREEHSHKEWIYWHFGGGYFAKTIYHRTLRQLIWRKGEETTTFTLKEKQDWWSVFVTKEESGEHSRGSEEIVEERDLVKLRKGEVIKLRHIFDRDRGTFQVKFQAKENCSTRVFQNDT